MCVEEYHTTLFVTETRYEELLNVTKYVISTDQVNRFIEQLCDQDKEYVYQFIQDNKEYALCHSSMS